MHGAVFTYGPHRRAFFVLARRHSAGAAPDCFGQPSTVDTSASRPHEPNPHTTIYSSRVLLDCTKQNCRARMRPLHHDVTLREPVVSVTQNAQAPCRSPDSVGSAAVPGSMGGVHHRRVGSRRPFGFNPVAIQIGVRALRALRTRVCFCLSKTPVKANCQQRFSTNGHHGIQGKFLRQVR